MRAWFESLGERERLLVVAAAGLLLLLLVYSLLWSPFHSGYTQLRENVTAQRETLQWMEQAVQRLQQLKQSHGGALHSMGGQSLLALADSSARQQGLASALKRVEPEGADNVKVWLEDAAFDTVITWLAGLSGSYGIHVDSVTLERVADAPGRVNARLTLQAPEQ